MGNGRKSKVRRTVRGTPRAKARKRARRDDRPYGSVEFRYLTDHAKDLEQYSGEWLLIHGPRVLAHSPRYSEIERVIQREQIAEPFIHYVPKEAEVNFADVIA